MTGQRRTLVMTGHRYPSRKVAVTCREELPSPAMTDRRQPS